MTRCPAWAMVLVAWGCGGEDERPPRLEPRPQPHPFSCAEIQGGMIREDGVVLVAGSEAACAADGLECPLFSDTSCDGGLHVAHCAAGLWLALCGAAE